MFSSGVAISGMISLITSAISFICSFISLFPQIIQTYKDKSVEGLSPYFLTSWLLGDIMSLFGAVMTKQLLFQIIMAVYYLTNDLVICGQYYYYGILHKNQLGVFSSAKFRGIENASMATSMLTFASQLGKVNAKDSSGVGGNFNNANETVGFVLSWLGAMFYVCSRLPQLIKNYNRKSTDGISPFLFWMTMISNITYNISIFTSETFLTNNNRTSFIINEMPFILGNSGTIIFDLIYFYQHYVLYSNAPSINRDLRLKEMSKDGKHINRRKPRQGDSKSEEYDMEDDDQLEMLL